jgi:hypothetical protein
MKPKDIAAAKTLLRDLNVTMRKLASGSVFRFQHLSQHI